MTRVKKARRIGSGWKGEGKAIELTSGPRFRRAEVDPFDRSVEESIRR
jgi:hypothetical protein